MTKTVKCFQLRAIIRSKILEKLIRFLCIISWVVSGPLSPGYFQQNVNYDIDVKLDDSNHILRGYEKMIYSNNSPDTLDFIWVHLWPNAYKDNQTAVAKQMWEYGSTRLYFSKEKDRGYIDSLNFSVNGKSAEVATHPDWIDVVKIMLPQPLAPGKRATIETPFKVKIPKVFSRLGHTGKHYEITQWYPKPAVYDKDGWHPMPYLNMGEFYSEFGTFDVKITLPEKYIVMATGTLVDGEEEYAWLDSLSVVGEEFKTMAKRDIKKRVKIMKKTQKKEKKAHHKLSDEPRLFKTLHFHQTNVHDFAWFADPNYIVQKGSLTLPASGRPVTLWSMYLPKNAEMWKNSLEYIHDAGYWYSKFYGDYPYDHITAVDGDMSAGGGMEYPNITVISKTPSKDVLEMVIMHEVGHNWFYGILGSNERDHAWMDEGLNEFSNFWYWEKKYGLDAPMKVMPDAFHKVILRTASMRWLGGYLGYQRRTMMRDDQPIELTSEAFYSRNYGAMIYSKTGEFTFFLKHYLGEEKFTEIMQDYYETWKFKHPQPEDFITIIHQHVDEDLSWYLDDVFNTTKYVDYGVTGLSGGMVAVENSGELKAPLEVVSYDPSNAEISREWVDGFSGHQRIALPAGTVSVALDPEEYLPDINQADNYSKHHGLQVIPIVDQPDYSRRVAGDLFPAVKINASNTGFGFTLTRGWFPPEAYSYSFSPVWDFKNDQLIGSAKVTRKLYRKFGLDEVNTSLSFLRDQGRKTFGFGSESYLRKPIYDDPYIRLHISGFYHQFENPSVFDPIIWDVEDPVLSLKIGAEYFIEHSPVLYGRLDMNFLSAANRSDRYAALTGVLTSSFHPWKKLKLDGEISFIRTYTDELSQYSSYFKGSADPDFENWVWNRSGGGELVMLKDQVISSGTGMRVPPSSSGSYQNAAGFGFSISGFLPASGVFFDILVPNNALENSGKNYDQLFSTGLSINLGMISIFLPLYMNWEPDLKPGSSDWKDNIRAEINYRPGKLKFSF